MIDHISVGVSDLDRSAKFYEVVLRSLGLTRLVTRPATVGFGKAYPEFWINLRADQPRVAMGSGVHICLRARTTAEVDAFHAAALASGGASDGAPGVRPHDRISYYAAFVVDPDGNRIEAVTFPDAPRTQQKRMAVARTQGPPSKTVFAKVVAVGVLATIVATTVTYNWSGPELIRLNIAAIIVVVVTLMYSKRWW